MDIEYAEVLLKKMANGIDPFTGELLPDHHLLNNPTITRALFCALSSIKNDKFIIKDINSLSDPKKVKKQQENYGKPWTPEDDQILCKMFEEDCPKKEICLYFKRSLGGIAARLVRLGKIKERSEYHIK